MFPSISRRVPTGSSVVVIGLGRFGSAMAEELEKTGTEVLAIDASAEVVQQYSPLLTHVVRADGTSEEALRQLSVPEFTTAVVAIGGNLAASILTASVLLKIGGIEVWAKASSPEQGRILEQMGIRHVFYPESDMGRRAAHVVAQSFLDYIELGYGFALVSTRAPKDLVGRELGETNLRRTAGITVIAVRDEDGSWVTAHAGTFIHDGDTVLLVGPAAALARLRAGA
ncbi:trk system potassium uptake protein TrkA [Bowdeniella nasicola]|uniref:Trk system potassium uptake protein TrkA n=1 Tax=Bowdeniella nasicola TaxID=208480 RepID=A0A1H3VSX6_9ACTO|nr:TrkA family potassium uptake protein [Bowdeniella nasicola]SDZ77870.1 trk system potassium uptake protein TrkA [Bowdeniella nasicola]